MNQDSSIKKLLKKILLDLGDLKAMDIVVINIKNRSALADYLVIASGNSSRHINSIVSNLIKNNKRNIIATEGIKSTDWSVVDFGDIILNVFKPDTRQHYDLEKIWQDGIEDEQQRFGYPNGFGDQVFAFGHQFRRAEQAHKLHKGFVHLYMCCIF